MALSEVQPFDDSHPLDAQQLKATKRGVVVGAIGFPFFAYKSHTSQGVVLESNADLIGFAIGAASRGVVWIGVSLPAFWFLEQGLLKLIGGDAPLNELGD